MGILPSNRQLGSGCSRSAPRRLIGCWLKREDYAIDDASAGPVFVHCRRGADRTGTVVACYRIAHDGWDNQKALQEAKGFGMSWTEVAMHHYVMRYQPQVNTAASAATATVTNN